MTQLLYYFVGIIVVFLIVFILVKKYCKSNNPENQHYNFELEPIGPKGYQTEIQIQNNNEAHCKINIISDQMSSNRQMSSINSKIQQSIQLNTPSHFKADTQRNKFVQDTINYLYDNSCRKRNVGNNFKYFLGEYYQSSDFLQQYNVKKLVSKQQLKQICTAYRAVRGDGNCFYTAFGFQFLEILLLKYTNDQFYKFLNENQIPFQIKLQNENIIDESNQQAFRNEFFYRLERLKLIQDINIRKQRLFEEFRAYEKENEQIDGCLYGLTTIFFRNLANKAVELNQLINHNFDSQILFQWEVECNDNEIVISSLANFLKLFIQLIFFTNSDFIVNKYGMEDDQKIILLIKPGHYNIGIKED
ncbi:unnamed protein product [Paramecium pentaurelia]|uniref:OTU domain-containing protein n=1 Tax=Paramecium pentaurelia TaxID=43138 RepID=A0A8S1XVW1_9CILI|nr:unnamed protein product [Paramecium pentaurelia]